MCDPEFEGVMKDIEHHQAKDAVHEAVNMLHAAPDPESEVERIEYLNPEVHTRSFICIHIHSIILWMMFAGLPGGDAAAAMAGAPPDQENDATHDVGGVH